MTYVYKEYPKWVGGQIVKDAEEEAAVLAAQAKPADPFDHDGDGKPGGSKPKAKRAPKTSADDTAAAPAADDDRMAVIAELKERGIKYFAGATTEALKAKLEGVS